MPKTLTEELAEWVKKREASRPRQDRNVVAFLALKSHVEEAIQAGYSLLTIWEHLHEKKKISYRYETFLRHVRRYIKGLPARDGQRPGRPTAPPPLPLQPVPRVPPEPTGFKFDSQPKKEDLL